jgi:RNase P subunit RPR2
VVALRQDIRELGICSECGGIAVYSYRLELAGEEETSVNVSVSCSMCGYNDSNRIIVPNTALYLMRYLFKPEARLFAEKAYIVPSLRVTAPTRKEKVEEGR